MLKKHGFEPLCKEEREDKLNDIDFMIHNAKNIHRLSENKTEWLEARSQALKLFAHMTLSNVTKIELKEKS
ncbi:hypothetical protein [Coxiella endosymbiont of Ornithodoros maritimus]|uniref:hypothetical protein n=1 Tax=Coxiella endosymbiont of Ornithodoros maritimus TaxID=1656172 RepID=UPI002264B349|nr:hypothetical protein [Coxiella endosymbiont of Ornithodoros maritimus]